MAKATGKPNVLLACDMLISRPPHRPWQVLQADLKQRRGKAGSELEDHDYHLTNPRRRTNSFSAAAGRSVLKTKFEAIDPEVIEYEEDVHGPGQADLADHNELEKMSTASSADTMGSVDEEEGAHAAVAGAEEQK